MNHREIISFWFFEFKKCQKKKVMASCLILQAVKEALTMTTFLILGCWNHMNTSHEELVSIKDRYQTIVQLIEMAKHQKSATLIGLGSTLCTNGNIQKVFTVKKPAKSQRNILKMTINFMIILLTLLLL